MEQKSKVNTEDVVFLKYCSSEQVTQLGESLLSVK
jgi:hypothetical protein